MTILVKGRDMPDTCGSCPCFHAESPMYCQAVKAAVQKPRIVHPYAKGRPEWCPLIEIPPHGRLIDADIPEDDKEVYGFFNDYDLQQLLDSRPTIIPAEGGER